MAAASASGNGSVSGALAYGGPSTGTAYFALASQSDFGVIPYVLAAPATGFPLLFSKSGVAGGATYYAEAFLDVKGTGKPDSSDPIGAYADSQGNPLPVYVPLIGGRALPPGRSWSTRRA